MEYLHLRSNVYIRIKTILEKFHDMRDELSSSVEMKYQYYCAKAIIMPLLQGKTVIIDTIELGSYFQALGHHLIKCKTDTIIVYCSPQNLEKHIEQSFPEILNYENCVIEDKYFSSCGHLNYEGAKLLTLKIIKDFF